MPAPESAVRNALTRIHGGDSSAVTALMPLVYDELRALAGSFFARRSGPSTLEPTAVVNEAFVKLARGAPTDWQSKAHFFAVAAKAMRQIIVDHARRKRSDKRGGDWQRITLTALPLAKSGSDELDAVMLDDALRHLAERDERQAQVVELRIFGGMSIEETAHVLGISVSSVEREWVTAKMWLRRALS